MNNLVYIAGLSHSGTTLLDLILGCYPEFVGLGEVARVIDRGVVDKTWYKDVDCSCGKKMPACPVWGSILTNLETMEDSSFYQKYQKIIETVNHNLGFNTTIVDSSKYLNYLKPIVEQSETGPKVIYLVKDVRNYVISQLDNLSYEEANRKSLLKSNAHYFFWQWYLMNRQMLNYLSSNRIDYLLIGYEELCLSTEKVINKIGEFLGLKLDDSILSISGTSSHSVLGNRMRTQKEKSKILYDYRWFQRKEWLIPAILYPNIIKFNKKNVYSHGFLKTWNK